MRGFQRPRLTYANVMSTLCFVLLTTGGVAYAAVSLPDNSVRSRHIVNGQVKAVDLNKASVAGAFQRRITTDCRQGAFGTYPELGAVGSVGADGKATCVEAVRGSAFVNQIGASIGTIYARKPSETTGIYCLSVSGQNPLGIVASAAYRLTGGPAIVSTENLPNSVGFASPDCEGSEIEVKTFSTSGAPMDAAFYVIAF